MKAPFVLSRIGLLALILILAASPLQGQISLQVGGGVGYAIPTTDFKGSPVDYFAGKNYGFDNGFNFHAKVRFGILGLRLTGEAGYSIFSNNGEAVAGGGTVDYAKNILAFKVGPEFQFSIPAAPITPYLGLNVALNSFSGKTTLKSLSGVPSGTYDMTGTTRLGAGGTLGVLLSVGGSTLDVALHYNLHNLTGKSWEGGDNRLDTYTALNDDKDPAYAPLDTKHVVSDSRSISSLVISVSYLFGF